MTIELTFIPALLLILLLAGAGRLLSLKLNQPEILGELILGMLLGAFVVLAPNAQEPVYDVAKIGILLLLFLTGMDLDFQKFKETMLPASGVAIGGIIVPFALGVAAGLCFGFSKSVSLFVGASLVATSVGISASILHEAGKLNTDTGALIIDSAVLDDVIGVMMMTVLFSSSTTGAVKLWDIIFMASLSILFFILSLTFGIRAMSELSERIPIESENLLLGGLTIILGFALITQKIGLAAVIGAFVAGLVTGQTNYEEPLRNSVSLVGYGFFIPVFFVTMGMRFDTGEFTSIGIFAVVLIGLAIVGKMLGVGLGAKLFGYGGNESLAAGIAMVPRAEVTLIIVHFGFRNGILGSDIVSTVVILVVITTLITPPLLWKFLRKI